MDVDVSSDATALRIPRLPLALLAVFVTVLVAARVSVTWEMPEERGQPLWLASGLAIGAALVVPKARRLAIVISSLAAITVNSAAFVRDDIGSVAGDLVTSTIEIVGGLLVFAWLFRSRDGLGRSGTTLVAFLLCFVVPAIAGGVAVAWFRPDDEVTFLWSWTLGNGLGMASAGALLLLARGPGNWLVGGDPGSNTVEFALATAITAGLVGVSFATDGQLTYLVVAGLLWLAVRFGPRIGVPAALATVIYACLRSADGAGPFGDGTTADLLNLQAFNTAVVLSTSLVGRYARGIDRERRRNHALFNALPDLITVQTGSGRLETLNVGDDTSAAADDAIRAQLRQQPPAPEPGHPHTDRRRITVDDAALLVESRSARIDRHTVLTVSRDITEPSRLLTDLRQAEERWKRLASTAYEGFVEFDAENRIVFATQRFAEIAGTDVEDLIGRRFAELFPNEDYSSVRAQTRSVRGGDTVTFETDYRRPDGSRVWCIVSADPLFDDQGRYAGAIMFAAETTDFHEEQAGRAAAEVRLASVEQLERQRIARHLHDGPLQSLVALSYRLHALTKGGPTTPEVAAALESVAIDSVRRLRSALEDLVPPTVPDGELGPALLRVGARFLTNESPHIDVEVATTRPIPEDLAIGLYQIGREAIINAILHADATEIRTVIEDRDDGFAIEIRDDGKGGIDATRSPDGHLGLRAMRDRAIEAGGTCRVRPGENGGTVVEAFLPRTRVEAPTS